MNKQLKPSELPLEDVRDTFEKLRWSEKVTETLVDVADSPDATTHQRAMACKLLCALVHNDVISPVLPDGRHVTQLVAGTCVSSLDGAPPIARREPDKLEEARSNYEERLSAVEFTLANVGPTLPQVRAKLQTEAAGLFGPPPGDSRDSN